MRKTGFFLTAGLFVLVQCRSVPTADRQPSGKVLDSSGYAYDPADRSCDGYPRLQVETMPGTCLGLVLAKDKANDAKADKGFVMPRTLVQIPGTDSFLLADMGGWKMGNGRLFLMSRGPGGAYGLKLLKFPLNMPHGLALSADGYYYLGETDRISRFHLKDLALADWQLVTDHLPHFKDHMHPLTQFAFDGRNNDMYVNSGAPTDHCSVDGAGAYKVCPETESKGMGAIYRIPGAKLKSIPPGGIRVFEHTASGLRNSMAMVVHPSGLLIQGENSRDFPEKEEPYEEINVIDPENPGGHYGWPMCYDFHATSPEWAFPDNADNPLRQRFTARVDCGANVRGETDYRPPHALMPPHAAPLNMLYYHGPMFPALEGKLIVGWHGYQTSGHRLVVYDVDEKGRPVLGETKGATYSVDQSGDCPGKAAFQPKGGLPRVAPYTEVISGWELIKGVRPRGTPVGFTVTPDGSIWIAEDKNRTVVRLAFTDERPRTLPCGGADRGGGSDGRIAMLAWRHALVSTPGLEQKFRAVEERVVNRYCAGCHGGLHETDVRRDRLDRLDYFVKNQWFAPGQPAASKIMQAAGRTGEVPAMPPGGSPQFFDSGEKAELLGLISSWIEALPGDIEKRMGRVTVAGVRELRDGPSPAAKICGRLENKDALWIDPRPQSETRAGGWVWSKAYLLPGDSRLNPTCAYPADGVFYVALRKI